jgi:hypothetical protein
MANKNINQFKANRDAAIKRVFHEILAMPEAEFKAELKSHENGDLAIALINATQHHLLDEYGWIENIGLEG